MDRESLPLCERLKVAATAADIAADVQDATAAIVRAAADGRTDDVERLAASVPTPTSSYPPSA